MEDTTKSTKLTKTLIKLNKLKNIIDNARSDFRSDVQAAFDNAMISYSKEYAVIRNEIDELMEELLKEEKDKLESDYQKTLNEIQKFKTMQKLLEDYFENYALLLD